MKSFFLSALTAGIMTASTAFATTNLNDASMVEETRSAEMFSGIILNAPVQVYVKQDNQSSLTIISDSRSAVNVKTEVVDGALIISAIDENSISPGTQIFVTASELCLLQVNGKGVIKAPEMINQDFMVIRVNGQGTVSADIRALKAAVMINGKGRVNLRGNAGETMYKVKGGGKVVSYGFESNKVDDTITQNKSMNKHIKEQQRKRLSVHN